VKRPRSDESGQSPLTFVLADDDRLAATSLSEALDRYGLFPLAVVHSAGDAVAATAQLRPDVLIVDLDFGPGPTGIDVAIQVRRQLPKLGVVMVTGYQDPRLLSPSLPSPPVGVVYLVKQKLQSPKQVAQASREAVTTATRGPRDGTLRRGVALTDQQIELLRLIAAGLSNNALADALTITPKAVEKAVTRLADRMGVDRSSESNLRVGLANRYWEYLGHHRG
jgi:DNA-binding NarL/FixJ family response regulator